MAVNNVANVRLGSCSVTWNGTDLGYTDEGTTVNISQDLVDITVDAEGTSLVDQRVVGMNATVSVTLKEVSNENIADVWAAAFPVQGDAAGADRVDLKYSDNRDESLLGSAATLLLTRRNAQGAANDEHFILWKAVATEVGDIVLSNEGETMLEVTFTGYVDSTNGLFTYGDSTT